MFEDAAPSRHRHRTNASPLRSFAPALLAMGACAWSSVSQAQTYLQLVSRDGPASRATFSIDMYSGASPLSAEIARIEQSEPGLIRIFVDRVDGVFSVGSGARLFATVEDLTLGEYRVELMLKQTSDWSSEEPQDYQLVHATRIAYTADAQIIPENPTTLDTVRVRLPSLAGCGDVLSTHVFGWVDYDSAATPTVLPDTYVHEVTLEYARWPCEGSGGGTDEPVEIVLDSLGGDPGEPMRPGLHRVVVNYGVTDEEWGYLSSSFSDGEIARFELRDRLPPRIAGTWYDVDHPGQGLTFQTQPSGELVVGWYTFDNTGAPAWILAQGQSSGKQAMLTGVLLDGGTFPSASASTATATPWGELTLDFLDCNHATLQWTSTLEGFADGSMDLIRNSSQEALACDQTPSSGAAGRWRLIERGADEEVPDAP